MNQPYSAFLYFILKMWANLYRLKLFLFSIHLLQYLAELIKKGGKVNCIIEKIC